MQAENNLKVFVKADGFDGKKTMVFPSHHAHVSGRVMLRGRGREGGREKREREREAAETELATSHFRVSLK